MQILLASAKIMNDRSATKGDACQSKKVNVLPDFTLSTPAFHQIIRCLRTGFAHFSERKVLRESCLLIDCYFLHNLFGITKTTKRNGKTGKRQFRGGEASPERHCYSITVPSCDTLISPCRCPYIRPSSRPDDRLSAYGHGHVQRIHLRVRNSA